MKHSIIIQIVCCLLFIQIVSSAFSNADFKTCYSSCSTAYATGVGLQTGNFEGKSKNDYLTAIYQYEACIRGYNTQASDKVYNKGVAYAPTITGFEQKGYCKYFWNDFVASEANQYQLGNLVKQCFALDNTGSPGNWPADLSAVDGCYYLLPANSPQADIDIGKQHYSESFVSCVKNCITLTTQEDEGNYNKCSAQCDATYEATKGAPTAAQLTAIANYQTCLKYSENCGRLNFYTFSDYQYKTYWEACYDPCIEAYKTETSATTQYTTRLDCIKACPIPDSSTYKKIDNTVPSNGSIAAFSCLIFVYLLSLLI